MVTRITLKLGTKHNKTFVFVAVRVNYKYLMYIVLYQSTKMCMYLCTFCNAYLIMEHLC